MTTSKSKSKSPNKNRKSLSKDRRETNATNAWQNVAWKTLAKRDSRIPGIEELKN